MSIIGKMTKSRGTWGNIKPTTQIKKSSKLYNRKKIKAKERRDMNG